MATRKQAPVTKRRVKRPKRRDPAAYHHGDLRCALLEAAHRQLRRGGADAVKMNVLATELGVSVAAPFRHFATREALLAALAEAGAERMARAMDVAAAAAPDPLAAQRARGVAYVKFCVSEPEVFRLLQHRDVITASPLLRALDERQRAAMDPVLGRDHTGHVSVDVARRSAGLLAAQALTFGLVHMVVAGLLGDIEPDTAAALAEELTGVLGEGLAPRGRETHE